jgi:hypothetical protein
MENRRHLPDVASEIIIKLFVAINYSGVKKMEIGLTNLLLLKYINGKFRDYF